MIDFEGNKKAEYGMSSSAVLHVVQAEGFRLPYRMVREYQQ